MIQHEAKPFPWWKRIPIQSKIQIGTATFALVIMLSGTFFMQWATKAYFHEKISRDLFMLSQVLAENSRAATVFDDEISATKVLDALKRNTSIEAAAIIKNGKIFSAYPSPNVAAGIFNNLREDTAVYFQNNHYYATTSIDVADKEIGRLALYSNLSEWDFINSQLHRLFAGLFTGFIVLIILIYFGLRTFITKPLSSLSVWASTVSKHKKFDMFAKKESDDEIGQLVDSLNNMLTELEKQQSIVLINERLTNEIQERTRVEIDLIDMRVRAETANEAKSRFLANMSHEIRTPMNVIMGFIEIVLESELSEMQRKHLSTVRQSAKLLHSLLNDILDVSKLEEGKLQLESIPFSVHHIINDTLKTFEIKARGKGLQFGASIDPDISGNYLGDPLRLNQILINLVGNALKFTEEGGVFIEVTKKPDNFLQFKVTDSGIGIAIEKLELVFQNFAQADSSVSRKYGGSGLGTTISKQLVELMGGKIWVESELGVGSHFYFEVRLPPTQLSLTNNEIAQTQSILAIDYRLKILIAEDVKENAELLKVRLNALGHSTTLTENGNEVISAFKKEPFDIILMDVQMPEKDGLTATREIRALPHGNQIPILALTASVLKENRLACDEAGMNGFVTKPIVFFELFSEMARVLKVDSPRVVEVPATPEFKMPVREGIDLARASARWTDEENYLHSLELFDSSHQNAAQIIKSALANKDVIKAKKILHALKGASGNLALTKVYAAVSSLSDNLRENNLAQVDAQLAELNIALQQISEIVEEFRPRFVLPNTAADINTFDNVKLDDIIDQLRIAFNKGETADELFKTALNVMQLRGVSQQSIQPLLTALDEFEFNRAIRLLNDLALQLKKREVHAYG